MAALALGLSLADLDLLTVGMVCDLVAVHSGDYEREATQADMDRFTRG